MTRTIFAPATPAGKSGVAIIRISGPNASACLSHLGVETTLQPRMATLKKLSNPTTHELIDHALLLYFPAPHSFTGEDILEIHHHGGVAIKNELLQVLAAIPSFHFAEAGEFAKQAFYNHKLDLTTTEGLADLIDAETEHQKRQALRQLNGTLSYQCQHLRERAIEARAIMEAVLDFPDEDIPDDTYDLVHELTSSLLDDINMILNDGGRGEKIREGFFGVILGAPNTGKSTLLNTLAKRDIAIVSNQAGTTRDIIEAHLDVHGYNVTIADTAGIRDTQESIEAEGIKRAISKTDEADFILCMLDDTSQNTAFFDTIDHPHKVFILNKADLCTPDIVFHVKQKSCFLISAKHNTGIEELLTHLKTTLFEQSYTTSSQLITRSRHRVHFNNASSHLSSSLEQTVPELKAEELRLATNELSAIVGLIDYESILDKLFSSFCIGK